MIKVIVSDMDGTLFKNHRETIFKLSDRNEAALKEIKNTNISFYVASGRMYCYGKKLLEDHGFKDIVCSGFNGADIYNNGSFPIRYHLDASCIEQVIQLVSEKYSYHFMQIQTLDCKRIFNDSSLDVVKKYVKQNEDFHIDQVLKISFEDFFRNYDTNLIGKFSVILNENNTAIQAFKDIQNLLKERYFVTMSNSLTIEICNKNANKGVFIQYLMDTFHYTKEEIAVIGDALNDAEMFPYSSYTFAMESGKEEVKKKARFIVKDVAECIQICMQENQKQK